ncbi:MAG TPA: hypothetical protein VF411_11055, partial [Bacteroidia bacterium]
KQVVTDGKQVVTDGKQVVTDGKQVVTDGKQVVTDDKQVVTGCYSLTLNRKRFLFMNRKIISSCVLKQGI